MPAGRMRSLVALLVVATLAGLAQPVSVLRVVTTEGEVLACRAMGRDDRVTLVFTHSMYGGEVRETWRAEAGDLARVRIVADRAAAAEYYATDGATRPVEGGFEVVAPPLRVPELRFRVDQIGNHRLRFGDEEIAVAENVGGSAGSTMSVARVPLILRVIDREAGCGG
ncbi:MAG TPA: DUF1850 domain-containing protein [Thermomicrobiales bacterium]|nr:DUF1850 domain-containing protein [Thermomicrobiales bacterium]